MYFDLAMLEVIIVRRSGRMSWEWRVVDRGRNTIVEGVELTRRAAQYRGERALFQLLASAWRQK